MNEISLDTLDNDTEAIIVRIDDELISKPRLLNLGFTRNTRIKRIRKSPSGDPVAYLVKGTLIALRNYEARHIKVSIIKSGV